MEKVDQLLDAFREVHAILTPEVRELVDKYKSAKDMHHIHSRDIERTKEKMLAILQCMEIPKIEPTIDSYLNVLSDRTGLLSLSNEIICSERRVACYEKELEELKTKLAMHNIVV